MFTRMPGPYSHSSASFFLYNVGLSSPRPLQVLPSISLYTFLSIYLELTYFVTAWPYSILQMSNLPVAPTY